MVSVLLSFLCDVTIVKGRSLGCLFFVFLGLISKLIRGPFTTMNYSSRDVDKVLSALIKRVQGISSYLFIWHWEGCWSAASFPSLELPFSLLASLLAAPLRVHQ